MSGHSKWATIKRAKGKTDAERSRIFTKLGREIAVAAKAGADINSNSKLRDAVAKARKNNMTNDAINRAIKKAGEAGGDNFEEIIYEGYGKNGVAVLVATLTDNRNRTASDVRCAFDKYGAGMGTPNSVSFLFNKQGEIFVPRIECAEEDLFLAATEAGADDFIADSEGYTIKTTPQNFSAVCDAVSALTANFESEILYAPLNEINLTEEQTSELEKLIDKLEESDDVQNVYHNAN